MMNDGTVSSLGNLRAPLQVEIRITEYCNLNCKYCYAMPFSGRRIELPDFKNVLDQLESMGVFLVYLAGGEPLLHPEFMKIFAYAIKKDMSIHVLTNATVITKELAEQIKTVICNATANVNFQVSLDSVDNDVNDSVRGLSELTKAGIENLIEAGIEPTIAAVLTSYNFNNVERIVEEYYPRIKTFNFIPLLFTKETVKNRHELVRGMDYRYYEMLTKVKLRIKELKNKYKDAELTVLEDRDMFPDQPEIFNAGCSAGVLQLTIMSNLDVITCAFAPNVVVGNIKNSSLKEIWQSNKLRSITSGVFPCIISNELAGMGSKSAWDFSA